MKSNIQKLDLFENAFDFLNFSIRNVITAKETNNQFYWKHALLNITLCIELFLKERLRREHPLLIYENINKFRPITPEMKTVDWESLISRCKYVIGEKNFDEIDAGRINLARKYRNQILHYHTILQFPSVYYDFANLMNFVRVFYEQQLRSNEQDYFYLHIQHDLRMEDNDMVNAFAEECVYYNETFMLKQTKEEIIEEQKYTYLIVHGKRLKRIPYGDPREFEGSDISLDYSRNCHDCLVIKGQIHLNGCDMERCPKCGEQLLVHDVKFVIG
jgi:hypothetical protein